MCVAWGTIGSLTGVLVPSVLRLGGSDASTHPGICVFAVHKINSRVRKAEYSVNLRDLVKLNRQMGHTH